MLSLLIYLLHRLLNQGLFDLLLLSAILVLIVPIEQPALLGFLSLRYLLCVCLPAFHRYLPHECLLAAHGCDHARPPIREGHMQLVCLVIVT